MNIEAILVAYNQTLDSSASYSALRRARVGITVCDNSTVSETVNVNRKIAVSDGVNYISMDGNAGLTKAYNRAFAELRKLPGDYIVCIFDDDTEIPEEYFTSLESALSDNDAWVFLPTVTDGTSGKFISPCRIDGCRVSGADEVFSIPQDKLSGINSGLALRRSVTDKYLYDEKIFLDYADHAFLRTLRSDGVKFKVFSSPLIQNFSRSTEITREASQIRFDIFRKDFSEFCSGGTLIDRLYCKAYLALRQFRINRIRQDKNDSEDIQK